jgi:hypothetical protein
LAILSRVSPFSDPEKSPERGFSATPFNPESLRTSASALNFPSIIFFMAIASVLKGPRKLA